MNYGFVHIIVRRKIWCGMGSPRRRKRWRLTFKVDLTSLIRFFLPSGSTRWGNLVESLSKRIWNYRQHENYIMENTRKVSLESTHHDMRVSPRLHPFLSRIWYKKIWSIRTLSSQLRGPMSTSSNPGKSGLSFQVRVYMGIWFHRLRKRKSLSHRRLPCKLHYFLFACQGSLLRVAICINGWFFPFSIVSKVESYGLKKEVLRTIESTMPKRYRRTIQGRLPIPFVMRRCIVQ